MFAPSHPLTHTSHISRTYSSQTTSKKNTNKENANALPSKTPSRAGPSKLLPSTSVRNGLGVKTVERNENRLVTQMGTEKEKAGDVKEIEPKRLFQSTTLPTTSKNQIPPSRSLSSLPSTQFRQPNTHKTPLPSRRLPPSSSRNVLHTPAPGPAIVLAPTPLPSASRTRRRSRQSLTPLRPSISESSFVTPLPSGRWEEEHSLESITEGINRLDVGLDGVAEVEEDGSEDEIEYMPPKVTELPWEPAWEHPDPLPIFTTLAALPPLWSPHDDSPLVLKVPELRLERESEVRIRLCSDDDLEEPMFRLKPAVPPLSAVKGLLNNRQPAIRPIASQVKPQPTVSTNATRPLVGPAVKKAAINKQTTARPTLPVGAKRPASTTTSGPPVAPIVARVPLPKVRLVPPKPQQTTSQRVITTNHPPLQSKESREFLDPILLDLASEPLGLEDFLFDLDVEEDKVGVPAELAHE